MIRRTSWSGRACLALALTLILLAAPAAWASPLAGPAFADWLAQLWHLVTPWVAAAETGASIDPDGLQAPVEKNSTNTEAWEPVPLAPVTTESSTEADDRGASMDPDG